MTSLTDSLRILSGNCFPKEESFRTIAISLLHMSDSDFNDDIKKIFNTIIAILAILIEKFIYFSSKLDIAHEGH